MSHPVVYFEILGRDGAALGDFYSGLFGWTMAPADAGGAYQRVDPAAGGIGGAIGAFAGAPSYVTFYVRCEDLSAGCARAVELGGSVLMEPRQVSDDVEAALIQDPEGHTVGLIRGV